MRSTERTTTLATRLAWMFAIFATASAGLALAIALPLADALIREQIERELAGAAKIMAVEIDENPALIHELVEEADELGIEGRVELVPSRPENLASCEPLGADEFACRHPLAIDPDRTMIVAIPIARFKAHRPAMWIAGVMVLVISALGAALAGRV